MSEEIPAMPARSDGQCHATTKSGTACRARPQQGQSFCVLHSNPERARELGRKGGKGNLHIKPEANPPAIGPLQTATQIRDFLAQLIIDVRMRLVEAKTASALSTLATSALRAISAAELEDRVSKLEEKVQAGRPAPTERTLPTDDEWMALFAQPAQAPDHDKDTAPEGLTAGLPKTADGWTLAELPAFVVADDDTNR